MQYKICIFSVDYIEEEDDNSINDDTLYNESIESQGDNDLILTPLDARQESSRQVLIKPLRV